MAESYCGTHLCKLTTCLCRPLFQERSVVNLDRYHSIYFAGHSAAPLNLLPDLLHHLPPTSYGPQNVCLGVKNRKEIRKYTLLFVTVGRVTVDSRALHALHIIVCSTLLTHSK